MGWVSMGYSVTRMWYVRSLSIAAYQLVTSTSMSRQRGRQRHPSRRPRPNNANPSILAGRTTTDHHSREIVFTDHRLHQSLDSCPVHLYCHVSPSFSVLEGGSTFRAHFSTASGRDIWLRCCGLCVPRSKKPFDVVYCRILPAYTIIYINIGFFA